MLTEASTSRIAQVNGIPVHFQEAGDGEAVILIHAYNPGTTAWLNFSKNLGPLSEHYRCIAVDWINHGRSGPLVHTELPHAANAKVIIGLMDELGIDKAHIIGNSSGGTCGLIMAARYQERVNKLVIGTCSASAGGGGVAHADAKLWLIAKSADRALQYVRESVDDFETLTRDKIRAAMLVHFFDPALVTDEMVEYLFKNATSCPDHWEAAAKSQRISEHLIYDELRSITAPTLILEGRDDHYYEQGFVMLNYINNSRLIVFKNCGHWPPYEKPDEFNREVLSFLSAS